MPNVTAMGTHRRARAARSVAPDPGRLARKVTCDDNVVLVETVCMSTNKHPDPARDMRPDSTTWPAYWRGVLEGSLIQDFREALRLRSGMSVRASVIDDLCTYYGCDEAACIDECVNWGLYFDEEWNAAANAEAFHRTTRSSSFSLLWAAYCQAEGYMWPGPVGIAEIVQRAGVRSGEHLDFASGGGTTSQLFARLGYRTTLADISTSMLDFVRFRFERRGTGATFIDLNTDALPLEAYDVITAVDVLWVVSDPERTARALHAALKPNGVLYANINPSASREARWELHNDELALRRMLHKTGFEPARRLPDAGTLYRKVMPSGPFRFYRECRDAILLSRLRTYYRRARDRVSVRSWRRHHG